jgi:hypothetical protein
MSKEQHAAIYRKPAKSRRDKHRLFLKAHAAPESFDIFFPPLDLAPHNMADVKQAIKVQLKALIPGECMAACQPAQPAP